MYLRESTILKICVRNKLEKTKQKDFEESEEFFSMFKKLIIEFKNAGAQVPEKEKLNYLLRTLPSSFSYIGDLIDVLKEEDKTVDFVKNKIKMIEERENEENVKSKSRYGNASAFKSEKTKDKSCYSCGETGHFQKDCPQFLNLNNSCRNGGRSRGTTQRQQRATTARRRSGATTFSQKKFQRRKCN